MSVMKSFMLFTVFSYYFSVSVCAPLNVHIIPHSHQDAGWLNTENNYFIGSGTENCVKCTFDTLLQALESNPSRTFSVSDIFFFNKWYTGLSEDKKLQVKNLVSKGQFNFVNGGWVMHDEATTTYKDQIDQMRLGIEFLSKEFGVRPKVAWQLDPFGHSSTSAYVFQKLGFENLVMVRIDYREKDYRKSQKTMEFNWQPYFDVDQGKTQIFTHITYGHYNPDGDTFGDSRDIFWNNYPSFNIPASKIYDFFKKVSGWYKSSQILFLYGDDFTFKNAESNYKLADYMINLFNKSEYKDKLTISYSSPDKYFEAVKKESIEFPTLKNTDFYPYSDYDQDIWTGYYTSRPYIKGFVRDSSNFLTQSSRLFLNELIHFNNHQKLAQNSKRVESFKAGIDSLRNSMGIAQHHDAVTGTERDFVAQDYISKLNNSNNLIRDSIAELFKLNKEKTRVCIESASDYSCKEQNPINPSNSDIKVIIINPGFSGDTPFRTYVTKGVAFAIFDENGAEVEYDSICYEQFSYCDVTIEVDYQVGKLSYSYIFKSSKDNKTLQNKAIQEGTDISLINKNAGAYTVTFNTSKGITIMDKNNSFEYVLNVKNGVYTYNISRDPFARKNRNGAYLFTTTDNRPNNFALEVEKSSYTVGKRLVQLNLFYNKSMQKIKFYVNNSWNNVFETETVIFKHRSPNTDGEAFVYSVASNIDNMINSLTSYWTDANQAIMMERRQNTRFNWQFKVDDPVSSNMYPVNSAISIRHVETNSNLEFTHDKNQATDKILTVFNDRSQAGTSIQKGEIQLLLDQYGNQDDRKGLATGIFEKESANIDFSIKHFVAVSNNFDKNYLDNIREKKPIFIVTEDTSATHKLKDLIPEIVEFSGDKCDLSIYYTQNGFLFQVFNKDDFYFSINAEKCYAKINPSKFLSLGVDVKEANLLGSTFRDRYGSDNLRFGINSKLKKNRGAMLSQIKPLDFKAFVVSLN